MIIPLIIVSVFVTVFLVYISKSSDSISGNKTIIAVVFVWLVSVVILLIFSLLKENDPYKKRLTFFPMLKKSGYSAVIADLANDYAERICNKHVLVYDTRWYIREFSNNWDWDSYSVRQFCSRMKLDYVVLVDSDPKGKILFELIDLSNAQKKDTICTINKIADAEKVVKKIFEFINVEFDSTQVLHQISKNAISAYEKAFTAWGNGDFLKSAFYFKKYRSFYKNDFLDIRAAETYVDAGFERIKNGNSGDYYFISAQDIVKNISAADSFYLTYANLVNARIYIYKKMWNKAFFSLKYIFERTEKIPEAYYFAERLHKSRIKKLGFKSSEQILKRAVLVNPAYLDAQILLAKEYFARGFHKKSEKTYYRILELYPKNKDAYFGLAAIAGAENKIGKLLNIYKKLIDVRPDCADAYYNLGVIYYKTENKEEAEKFFKKAVDISDHSDSYFYLGLIALEKNNREDALKYFKNRVGKRTGPGDHFADKAAEKIREILNAEKNRAGKKNS